MPIAVVNDWSPIVLVLGNLLAPLQLGCKVPFRCKAAVHTTHLYIYTQSDPWPDATEIIDIFKNMFNCLHCGKILMGVKESILYRVVPMCESILHTRSHPSSSAETKPLTWQPRPLLHGNPPIATRVELNWRFLPGRWNLWWWLEEAYTPDPWPPTLEHIARDATSTMEQWSMLLNNIN